MTAHEQDGNRRAKNEKKRGHRAALSFEGSPKKKEGKKKNACSKNKTLDGARVEKRGFLDGFEGGRRASGGKIRLTPKKT